MDGWRGRHEMVRIGINTWVIFEESRYEMVKEIKPHHL